MECKISRLSILGIALAMLVASFAHAAFDFTTPKGDNTPPKTPPALQADADRLQSILDKSNKRQLDFLNKGARSPMDGLVDLRMSVLEARGKDAEIGALALRPDLKEAIQRELVKNEIRKDPEKIEDEKEKKATREAAKKGPTVAEMEELLKKRADGKSVPFTDDQMKDLAALLQLENRKLSEGGEYADLAKKQLIDELAIQVADSPGVTPKLPPAVLGKIKAEYLKKNPGEKEAVEKDGLTGEKMLAFLRANPDAVTLTPREWLDAGADLAKQNYQNGGRAFSIAHAEQLLRNANDPRVNPDAPKGPQPSVADLLPHLGGKQPPPGVHPPGQLFDLGKGPSVGGPRGAGGNGGHGGGGNGFRQGGGGSGAGPRSINEWDLLGFPTTAAFISDEERAKLKKLRNPGEKRLGGDVALTMAGQAGTSHCSLTHVAKNPESEREAARALAASRTDASAPPPRCPLRSLIAKHCVEGGAITGIGMSGVSQVFQYRLDVESNGPSITGGDDHALLTTMVPCADIENLSLVRPMTPAEFSKQERFGVMMNRNCAINSSPGSPNKCLIMAEVTKRSGNPAFVTFNSALPKGDDTNHGEKTEQGDSGGGVYAVVKNAQEQDETVVMGTISNVLVGHPLGDGAVGGAGSGTMLSWLNGMLPDTPRVTQRPQGFQDLRSATASARRPLNTETHNQ